MAPDVLLQAIGERGLGLGVVVGDRVRPADDVVSGQVATPVGEREAQPEQREP